MMTTNPVRFTLMDGLILIVACALGMGLATHFLRRDTPPERVPSRVVWAASSVGWAGVIAGPLVLAAQRFRGRRAALGPGEWLWLAPLSLYMPASASTFLGGGGDGGLVLLVLWVVVQLVLSLAAAGYLVAGVLGMRSAPACRWTDLVGCLVCAAVGPAIALAVNEALSQL